MSTLSVIHPTLLDFNQALDPNGRVMAAIELLNNLSPMTEDATAIEANGLTGHTYAVRTGIPAPTWRKLYGGVQPTKSTRVKVTDDCGMLENYSEIDKALADLNGNAAAFRASEHMAVLEGFKQEIESTLVYGNSSTEPEAFTGLAPRYNLTTAQNGENIILGGSADTDNTSVWLIGWGPNSVHLFYPQGSRSGFQITDKGQVTSENMDASFGRAEIYRTHFRWDVGLAVPDWRYIVRIPNIEVSALTKAASAGADLVDLMTQACVLIHSLSGVKPVFYCNRTVLSFLRRQMVNFVKASTLMMDEVGGRRTMTFDGIPVHQCDAIVNNETLVA